MAYKVLRYFEDLQDNGRAYRPGDTYPRMGHKVSDERLAELSGADNLRGVKLIEIEKEKVEKVEKKAEPRRRGKKA